MKNIKNVLFWFLFVLFLEMVLKIALFDNVLNLNILYTIIFIIPIAFLLQMLSTLGSVIINKIVSYILISFITVIFIAQLLYYKTYLSIFSIYSMGKAEQLVDYIDTIIKIIGQNIVVIIIMFIPLIVFIFFNKYFMSYKTSEIKDLLILLCGIIIFQVAANLALLITIEDSYSAKELYYETHSPTLSTSKLGLLTTMRVDLKRLIVGFEEINKLEPYPSLEEVPKNEEEEPKRIEHNVMEIDFDELIKNESNKTMKDMHAYFKNITPTAKNEYTGMFKGKNLIVFLAESFYPIAIDENLTPTLYKLATEGFNFPNFYTPLFPVSTTDGEYITVTSLIPKEGVWSAYRSSDNYFPFVLGNSFKEMGYKTTSYHNHTATYYYRNLSHPNYGYDFYACGRGLNINCKRWPESDLEMIDATYNSYVKKNPFLTYYVTVSGHLRYTRTGNSIAYKNWSYVKDLKYSDSIKAYMACHIELDKALANLIKYLEESNQLEDTVIAISSDHYPYGLTLDEINEKSTYERDEIFEMHHSSFILWNSETKPVTIDKIGSSLDILPTLLNLFGVEYDSRLLMGKDILSDSDPLVIFSNRSFITDKGRYNSITNSFESSNGGKVDKKYIESISKDIYNKFYLSRQIIDNDYYRKVFNK